MSLAARRGLLLVLTAYEVRFVLIGGMAVVAHGHARTTRDVDIVYDTALDNCARLASALRELRAQVITADALPPDGEISAEWLGEGGHFVFATEQGQLDALSRMSVGEYWDLEPTAVESELRDGSIVQVMSYEHLLRSKRAAGRKRDLLDIEALQELRGGNAEDRSAVD